MKSLLAVLAGLVVCVSLQAEPSVYKIRLTRARSGASTVSRITFSGYMVIDPRTNRLAFIKLDAPLKRFSVQEPLDWRSGIIHTSQRGSFSYLVIDGTDELSGLRAKGVNNFLDPVDHEPSPRAVTIGGSDIFVLQDGGATYVDEFSGVMVYDAVKTNKAIQLGRSFDDTINDLKAELTAKGNFEG